MIILGIILILIGLLAPRLHILTPIGLVLVIIGVCFWIFTPTYVYY